MNGSTCDWQISCKEIKQRGDYLLQSGQWSDCSFLVGTEPNQVVIKGHKLLLAMSSPVFEAMFYSRLAEKDERIPILDVQIEAFKALLEYIYTDNININSFDKACELYYGAKKYMLPHLLKECTKYILSDVNPKNACRAYEFANLFEEPVLMQKCLQIMTTQTIEVLNQSSFEDADINTVITLFEQNILNINSELDLFGAAIRYAKAQPNNSQDAQPNPDLQEPTPPVQPDAEDSSNDAGKNIHMESLGDQPALAGASSNPTVSLTPSTSQPVFMDTGVCSDPPAAVPVSNAARITEKDVRMASASVSQTQTRKICGDQNAPASRLSIRNAVTKIRFLTLTPKQFVDGPAKSSLLSQSETFAILMNISSANCNVPMPNGFSNFTTTRTQKCGSNITSSSHHRC